MKKIGFFILLALMLNWGNSYSQTEIDEIEWKLPPLQALIDSASVNSPIVKLADANVKMGQYELTDTQRDWLRKLNLSADTRLGSMIDYNRMINMSGGAFIPPSDNIYMLNYGLGFSAFLPLSDVFDRKRTIQKARLKVEQAEIQKNETLNQVKQLVIAAYYDALSVQNVLAMRNEISFSLGMMYDQSKIDYTESRISLADFTKATETYLLAQSEQETQKNNFLKAVRILEVIVGIELIK